jgi:RNA-binding protein 25
VGRIPASATDDFVERLLQQCGKVANWKRMMDPISNTPRPFGFARFENEEGALRALRLLSNLEIDGNQLLLNVDDKTREALDRYQKNKAAIANMKLQQQQQQQQQSASDASAPVDGKPAEEPAAEKPSEEAPAEKADEDVPDEEIVAKIKALMSDKKAGDFLKGMETSASEDGEGAESGKKDEDRQGGSSSWDKELEKERREREKERARERERRRGEREREARKRERDEREYREMEKDWETREREKERLRERRERDEKKEREWQIEKELNYDEEEDRKRRKAGKRRREREREEQDDEEDRRKEIEEEQARLEEERRRQEEELRRQQEAEADEQRASVKRSYDDAENGLTPISPDSSDQRCPLVPWLLAPSNAQLYLRCRYSRVKLGLRISAPTLKKPTKLGVTPGFNLEEEQNPLTNPKRKKLVPLEPMRTEEQIKKEREEEAKQIVAMIPAGKADLFSFQLNWDIVDEVPDFIS